MPHANWRGHYDRGTNSAGVEVPQSIVWPGKRLRAYLASDADDVPGPWIGSLARGMADQSGLLYRRNRYYDPATGQFTQEDPIGLAGGLNLYGYAGGDPVNFSDPFGLCPIPASSCLGREGADLGVGLVPVVGNLDDAHTALRGRNIVTGEEVGVGDRLFAAAAVVLPVSGSSLRAGKVVIGETMTRVRAHASRIGAGVFEPTAKTIKEGFKENMSWLRRQMREGNEIVDIGLDPNRAVRSPFYRSETELIERRGYPVTRSSE